MKANGCEKSESAADRISSVVLIYCAHEGRASCSNCNLLAESYYENSSSSRLHYGSRREFFSFNFTTFHFWTIIKRPPTVTCPSKHSQKKFNHCATLICKKPFCLRLNRFSHSASFQLLSNDSQNKKIPKIIVVVMTIAQCGGEKHHFDIAARKF